MRGKEQVAYLQQVLDGITPAYAGKSAALSRAPAGQRDHPRVCGEKTLGGSSGRWLMGSPPRMRGKGGLRLPHGPLHRITPAYAGKRLACNDNAPLVRDHPRVYGEKRRPMHHSHTLPGSPPRMRGKVRLLRPEVHELGITPAYAGKRASCKIVHNKTPDHPRVCGEKP